MKIVFLIRSLETGGAERQCILLAKALQQRGHCVTILVFYNGGSLEKDLQGSAVEFRSLNKKGRFDVFGFYRRLIAELKSIKPDLLHSYLTMSNLISISLKPFLRSFGSPKIIWGLRASNMDLKQYDWLNQLSEYCEVKGSKLPNHIIVNSKAGLDHAKARGFNVDKMTVISNGIDIDRFFPDPKAREVERKRLKIAVDDILVGLVARLDPMKDHRTFFAAALLLRAQNSHYKFICVGGGSKAYKETLQNLKSVKELGNHLIWQENTDNIQSLYNALDIVCQTSAFGEGFSNVIGEAMACGKPVVATDVGDAAMIVDNLGKIVPIKNPQALANACLEMSALKMDSQINSQAIRDRIVDHFSAVTLVNRTEELLERCR